MAGQGGSKHRKRAAKGRRHQKRIKAGVNIARVRKSFEDKGQTWDPKNNPAQLAALNHHARRHVQVSEFTHH